MTPCDRVTMMERTQQNIMQQLKHLEMLLPPYWFKTLVKSCQSMPTYHLTILPAEPHHTLSPYLQLPKPQQQTPEEPLMSTPTLLNNPCVEEQPLIPFLSIRSSSAIPSFTINKNLLLRVEDVIAKYPRLVGENKACTLVSKLA